MVTPGEHQETTLIVPDISLLGRIIDRLQIIQILSYSITMDGGGSVQPLARVVCLHLAPQKSPHIVPHMAARLLFFITSTDNLLYNIDFTVLLKY